MMSLCYKKTDLEKTLLYASGFLGTIPLLMIKGNTASTYIVLLLVLRAVIELVVQEKMNINLSITKYYIMIAVISVISAVHCLCSDLPVWWKDVQQKELIWVFIYLFLLLYYSTADNHHKIKYYVRGVYAAAVFQLFWGYMQFVMIKGFRIDLNRLVFWDILRITEETSHYKGQELQLSGLCWHVANMTPLMLFGYVFTKKKILKSLFLLFFFVSGSRTMLLGGLFCVGIDCVRILSKRVVRVKVKTIQVLLLSCVAVIPVLVMKSDALLSVTQKMWSLVESFLLMSTEESANVHANYWTSIPLITMQNDLMTNLFGFGLRCSGYPFAKYFLQYTSMESAWVVECDYINILWNTGYIGFFITYFWIIRQVYISRNLDYRYFLFLAGLLCSGITYNVQFNWCWILMMFLFVLIDYRIPSEQVVE